MSIAILGIGPVSALGCGIASLKDGLEGTNRPAIRQHAIEIAAGKISLPVYEAEIQGLDRFVPRASLRRIDRFSQMALLAANLAIEDSAAPLPEDTSRVGLIFGSAYGPALTSFRFLDGIIDYGDKCGSPTLFTNSVHNSLASLVSMSLRIFGPSNTMTCFHQTAKTIFQTAELWLENGVVDSVLIGLGDEYCPVLGYAAATSASKFSEIRPFDLEECSYIPGEGFICFLLGRESEACHATLSNGDDGGDYIFLAANGELEGSHGYRHLLASGKRCAAHSPLFGSMPLGIGFDIAFAALSIRQGLIYPAPASTFKAPVSLGEKESIACVQHWKGGGFSICLNKPIGTNIHA
jgi:3-oxoacyl-[acyl-carrier-protein] synthase II